MKVSFESVMGLMVTIMSSVAGLQQPTQKPGVPSTVKTKKERLTLLEETYSICEDEGNFPRVNRKRTLCLTTHSYQDVKCSRLPNKHTFMGFRGLKRTEVPYCPH